MQQQIPHTGLKCGRVRDDNVTAKANACVGKQDDSEKARGDRDNGGITWPSERIVVN
jgi:hypothetical protein